MVIIVAVLTYNGPASTVYTDYSWVFYNNYIHSYIIYIKKKN